MRAEEKGVTRRHFVLLRASLFAQYRCLGSMLAPSAEGLERISRPEVLLFTAFSSDSSSAEVVGSWKDAWVGFGSWWPYSHVCQCSEMKSIGESRVASRG